MKERIKFINETLEIPLDKNEMKYVECLTNLPNIESYHVYLARKFGKIRMSNIAIANHLYEIHLKSQ